MNESNIVGCGDYVVGIQDTFGKCWASISIPVRVGEAYTMWRISDDPEVMVSTGRRGSAVVCRIIKTADMQELLSFWEACRAQYEDSHSLCLSAGAWYEVILD
jgi:hypothetical protein